MDPATILFGLGVGVLVGVTGMGGGSLMTPLLILVVGVKPVVAVGTDLAYAAITKTVGGWRHFTKGTVFPRMAFWLAVGSCPAALAGVWLLDRLRASWGDDFDTFMLLAIGGTLLLTARWCSCGRWRSPTWRRASAGRSGWRHGTRSPPSRSAPRSGSCSASRPPAPAR